MKRHLAASGRAPDLRTGMRMAAESIDSRAALGKLRALAEFSNRDFGN